MSEYEVDTLIMVINWSPLIRGENETSQALLDLSSA